jgi:hypothetical protein
LSSKNICDKNDFNDYENFKDFIVNHYEINHVELFNYIKYVKIKRQIIKSNNQIKYEKYINEINDTIKIMADHNIFHNINIRKYLFRIDNFLKLIETKRESFLSTINIVRNLFKLKDDEKINYKILTNLNLILLRYQIFLKNSKKLIYLINKLVDLEYSFGIDHKLIKLNNVERNILGKKSEYTANKIIDKYIDKLNNEYESINKKYYYETNVNLIKLLNIDMYHDNNIKGEVDGIVLYYDGKNYIIEKIIEVKSSIKSIFDDINKFLFLQKYINDLDPEIIMTYKNYTFTRDSFINIINQPLHLWTIYLCINNIYRDVIEKSHLYFSTVLKIVDDNFINDYYINNNDNSIKEKYNIIIKNRDLIDNLFNVWKKNVMLDTDYCNIYVSKVI